MASASTTHAWLSEFGTRKKQRVDVKAGGLWHFLRTLPNLNESIVCLGTDFVFEPASGGVIEPQNGVGPIDVCTKAEDTNALANGRTISSALEDDECTQMIWLAVPGVEELERIQHKGTFAILVPRVVLGQHLQQIWSCTSVEGEGVSQWHLLHGYRGSSQCCT